MTGLGVPEATSPALGLKASIWQALRLHLFSFPLCQLTFLHSLRKSERPLEGILSGL
jgi:hypothetical protein